MVVVAAHGGGGGTWGEGMGLQSDEKASAIVDLAVFGRSARTRLYCAGFDSQAAVCCSRTTSWCAMAPHSWKRRFTKNAPI